MSNEDIDYNLLKLFYAVCQNRSFSKTAELLGITQPSISYSMKKLEESLGITLFNRENNMALTPEAESLLPYVEEAINSIKRGSVEITNITNLKSGNICIGVPSHIGVFLLTSIIKKFNNNHPNIKMKITCKSTKELFRLLNNNELDVVIDCSPLDENIYDFEIEKISKEKCVIACNKKVKELLNRKVPACEILKYPLIIPSRNSGNTREIFRTFEKKKIILNPTFEVTTSDMIAEMIEKNLGIGYLFEKTINSYQNICKVDFDINIPEIDIFLLYKNRILSLTAQEFVNYILENKGKF